MIQKTSSRISGFTLVELALAMVVIGLLIAIVIGGARMRDNAQAMDVIKQLTLYEASALKFREIYGSLPGDIVDPSARLANCNAAPCNRAGNGDGALDVTMLPADVYTTSAERFTFWNHLLTAGLVTGYDGTDALAFGQGLPLADVGGGYSIYYSASSGFGGWPYTAGRSHHAISFAACSNPETGVGTCATIKAAMAYKIDKKMDDGLASWGKVQCSLALTCSTSGTAATSVYNVDPNTMTALKYLTKF